MNQSTTVIQADCNGALNLFELGLDMKYHFVQTVQEIPTDWIYKLSPYTTPNSQWLIDHWRKGRRWRPID
jgi:hypothetical protein